MDKNGLISSKRLEKICRNCGKKFSVPICRDFREHHCSSECKKLEKIKKKEERKRGCLSCDSVFYPRRTQLNTGGGNYCTTTCFNKSRIGLKNSEETKAKRVNSFLNSEYNKNRPKGRNHPSFKEDYIENGYKFISNEKGIKVQEHRYLMEMHLGRKLKSHEVVHHKDRNKLNNKLDNLQLMTRAQHAKEHAHEKPNATRSK